MKTCTDCATALPPYMKRCLSCATKRYSATVDDGVDEPDPLASLRALLAETTAQRNAAEAEVERLQKMLGPTDQYMECREMREDLDRLHDQCANEMANCDRAEAEVERLRTAMERALHDFETADCDEEVNAVAADLAAALGDGPHPLVLPLTGPNSAAAVLADRDRWKAEAEALKSAAALAAGCTESIKAAKDMARNEANRWKAEAERYREALAEIARRPDWAKSVASHALDQVAGEAVKP